MLRVLIRCTDDKIEKRERERENEISPRVLRGHFSYGFGGPGAYAERQKYRMIELMN